MMSKKKNILLINDVTGYGRVSSFAMMPIFSAYGFHPYVLPTSIVSNTMDYGSSEILDTTNFMARTIKKWRDFNFKFDTICTGFINSSEQVNIIMNLIESQESPFVMVDPIMAEDGELYPGMYEKAVECNRKLISKSNLCIPNLTEAEMLSNLYVGEKVLDDNQFKNILDAMEDLGAKDIVITSCMDNNTNTFNLVYDYQTKAVRKIKYKNNPIQFIGTGDVFSATLMAELLNGNNLFSSVRLAGDFVYKVILDNENNNDRYDLYIENSLKHINK